mgnify:CR=1 FL=1
MTNSDIFEGDNIRQRAVDCVQLTDNVVESYPHGIIHGIQKDALQNGWDAALKHSKSFIQNNWKFEFKLFKNSKGKILFSMTDSGTSGLSGKKTAADITPESYDISEEERWARWESLAFNKKTSDSLGARGQGKMIFIGASKNYTIYYDSLRENNDYRFGASRAERTRFPVIHYDGKDAKQKIKEELDIEPIEEQGTRVIIINPIDELIESIKSGEFLKYIEETWWPIISKHGAKIIISDYGKIREASVPARIVNLFNKKESCSFKKKLEENVKVIIGRNKEIIKRIYIAYDKEGKLPEFDRGIAFFRGGMKISTVEMAAQRDIKNKIYGFVEFDRKLERSLREIETPNHYNFRSYKLWKVVKNCIEDKLEIFGNEKLGLGIDRRELQKQRRNNAENIALSRLRRITKGWNVSNVPGGGGGGGTGGGGSTKKIAIRLSGLNFPNVENIPRLNYGESLKGFYPLFRNRTKNNVKVHCQIQILSGDRRILELENCEYELESKSGWLDFIKKYEFSATEKLFPESGKYRLLLKITDYDSKEELDKIVRFFWVNKSPSLKAPFEITREDFSEAPPQFPHHGKQWFLYPKGNDRFTFTYNIFHNLYEVNESSEDKLADYLTEIFIEGVIALVLRRIDNEGIDNIKEMKPFNLDQLKSENLFDIYNEVTGEISRAKGKISI